MSKRKLAGKRKSPKKPTVRLDALFDESSGELTEFGKAEQRRLKAGQDADRSSSAISGESRRKRKAVRQFKRSGKLPGKK